MAVLSSSRVRAGVRSVLGAVLIRGCVDFLESSDSSWESIVCLESVVDDESELCDANSEGVDDCEEEGRARQEILLVERRQRTVEGGQAKHAPNTGQSEQSISLHQPIRTQ